MDVVPRLAPEQPEQEDLVRDCPRLADTRRRETGALSSGRLQESGPATSNSTAKPDDVPLTLDRLPGRNEK